MDFTEDQIQRYSRHILLQDVGVEGQEKINNGKVLIVGAGGLGAPIALYLAAAGVGTIGIIDGDVVDLSNLQRQVIHFTPDVNKPKVISAKEKINLINPDVKVVTYQKLLTAENALEIINEYDFVVDGTDNFPVKFLINDACVIAKKPFSHGGILRFDGQTLTYVPGSACYRCLFHSPPPPNAVPTCSQAGVLGAIAGMLGTIQAAEVLKYLTGVGDLLTNRLLTFNAKTMEFRTVHSKHNDNCPVCGNHPTVTGLVDYEQAVCDLETHRKQKAAQSTN
jgi:molybdopterin/thiamine biosynthesis adenylyltransferase